jgi:predicted dehydrogenase
VRAGVVGLGWAAGAFHVPALRAIGSVQIVGGADPSEQARAAWVKSTGAPAFESIEHLMDATQPELVVVGTPPASHAELCIRALEGGADVICEKPFVSTVEEADRVLATADAAGRSVAVNHQYPAKPVFRAVKEQIGRPDVGRLVFCQISQLMDMPPWEEPVPWRAAMPNRTLFEAGCHLVDLMLELFGELPQAVYARHSRGLDAPREADAVHLVMLEFSDGRLAQITIDRLCKAPTRYIELRADCEHASLRASHGGRVLIQMGMKRAERPGIRFLYGLGGLAWAEVGTRRKMLARNPRNPSVAATVMLFDEIVTALQEGREPPASGRRARDGLLVIEAAYRSAESGRRVELANAS